MDANGLGQATLALLALNLGCQDFHGPAALSKTSAQNQIHANPYKSIQIHTYPYKSIQIHTNPCKSIQILGCQDFHGPAALFNHCPESNPYCPTEQTFIES